MGSGKVYKCKDCGKEFAVMTGVGMLFPEVYKKTVARIRRGKYGEEWKRLMKETPGCAVNIVTELMICEECGTPKKEMNLSLYAPKPGKEMPTPLPFELKRNYTLLAEYPHRCEKCGGSCKIRPESKWPKRLRCPKCEGVMVTNPDMMVMWD